MIKETIQNLTDKDMLHIEEKLKRKNFFSNMFVTGIQYSLEKNTITVTIENTKVFKYNLGATMSMIFEMLDKYNFDKVYINSDNPLVSFRIKNKFY